MIRLPVSINAVLRKRLGYLPDKTDARDVPIGAAALATTPPNSYLPHHGLPPLYQEGNSCTGRIVHAFRIGEVNHGRHCPELAGLHNYWLSRWLWGGENRDGGSYIREGVKAAVKFGIATSDKWPETVWKVQVSPSGAAQRTAHKLRGVRGYYRLDPNNHTEIRQVLASGYAVFGGWRVDKAFLDKSGPQIIDRIVVPDVSLGHAWPIDGYDGELYHMPNSWRGWRGTRHVASGAWMTAEFVEQALDMWAIIVDNPLREAA